MKASSRLEIVPFFFVMNSFPKSLMYASPFTIDVHRSVGATRHNLTTESTLLISMSDSDVELIENDDEHHQELNSSTILINTSITVSTRNSSSSSTTNTPTSLHFKFSGYSIWLDFMDDMNSNNMDHNYYNISQDVEQMNQAISYAASLYSVQPIPQPHVTVLYGVEKWTEVQARERFQKLGRWIKENSLYVTKTSTSTSSFSLGWPPLLPKGILSDKEIFGENNATMSMAWMEISYKTSTEHERLIDAAYEIFHPDGIAGRKGQFWLPHLSLCYDNPEDSRFDLTGAFHIVSRFPSLLNTKIPSGISLWNTSGTIEEWNCMERFSFS